MDFDSDRFSDDELWAVFDRLFPHGFAGPDVLHELAPDGWESSPLLAVFHPSLSQIFDEAYREAVEEALKAPPPATVRAYDAVYGDPPQGWPPIA